MQVKNVTDFKCVLNMNLQINLSFVRPLTVEKEKLPLTCCLSQLFWCLRFPSSKDVFSYGIMIMTHLFGRNQEWHRKGFTHMYTSWKHNSVNDLAWHWQAPLLKISSIPNSWRNQEWYRERVQTNVYHENTTVWTTLLHIGKPLFWKFISYLNHETAELLKAIFYWKTLLHVIVYWRLMCVGNR